MNNLVALAGLCAVLVGVALLSFPVALIVAGLLVAYLAVRGDADARRHRGVNPNPPPAGPPPAVRTRAHAPADREPGGTPAPPPRRHHAHSEN